MSPDLAVIDINMPGYNGIELITMLTHENINCKFIILTGYDEFKYAQQAIHLGVHDYILKPINYNLFAETLLDIRNVVEKQANINNKIQDIEKENHQYLSDNFYNDLVNCNFLTYNMYKSDEILTEKFFLFYKVFSVIICDFSCNPYLVDTENIRHSLNSNIYDCSFAACIDNKNRLFIIIDSSNHNIFNNFIRSLHNFLNDMKINFTIGIGNNYSQFEQIYLSYNEACVALQNAYIFKNSIIHYKAIEDSSIHSPINSKRKNLLKFYISEGDLKEINMLMDEIYESLRRQKTTFQFIVLQTLELLNLLLEVLGEYSSYQISHFDLTGNIFDELIQLSSLENIKDWILEFYKKSINNILIDKQSFSKITIKVESYIIEHYFDPELSITKISEELYLNYSYLCDCFKRDKGITINDYLNQIRIDKALELFNNNITNINYVSEKTGFNNASYFSKRFKRTVGLTPSEYIKAISLNLS